LVKPDQAETVLYTRLERDEARRGLVGLNFFFQGAPLKNVEEFRHRLEDFANGREPAKGFNFTCDFDDATVALRVLLARIRERSYWRLHKVNFSPYPADARRDILEIQ
jgi:hypothetical protein